MKTSLKLLGISLAVFSTTVFALPELSPPIPDGAHINPAQSSASHMHIDQTQPKAILNWNSFNIGAAESVHFQQPQNGIALNRINPGLGVSQIAGKLSATGKIILVNPAGIHFTPTSRVDVAGLIATTANISDQNFKNGNYQFKDDSNRSGKILNEGTINIHAKEHGFAAFIAPHVANTGTINASLGKIAMYSTTKFVMGFDGNDLVHFHVAPEVVKDAIVKGKMTANQISFTHEHAQQVLDNAIKIADNSVARSVRQENGVIILSAAPESDVVVKDKKGLTYVATKDTNQPGSPKSSVMIANLNPQTAVVSLASLSTNEAEADYEMIHSEMKSVASSLSTHESDNDSDFDFSVRSINSEMSSLSSHESDQDSDFDFDIRSIGTVESSISSSSHSDNEFLMQSLNEISKEFDSRTNMNYLHNSHAQGVASSESFDAEQTVNLKFRFASQMQYSIDEVVPSSSELGSFENFDIRSVDSSLNSFSSHESENSFTLASNSIDTLHLNFRFNYQDRFVDEDGLNQINLSSNLDMQLQRTLRLNFRFASASIEQPVLVNVPQAEDIYIPEVNTPTNDIAVAAPSKPTVKMGYNVSIYADPCLEKDKEELNSCLQNKTDLITYLDEETSTDLSHVTVGDVNL